MNNAFFAKPSTDPGLNYALTRLLIGLTNDNPTVGVAGESNGQIGGSDTLRYSPATSTASAWMQVNFVGGNLILLAGAETAAVAEQLIPGVFGGVAVQSTYGMSQVFADAANVILDSIPVLYGLGGKPLFIAGHSFGGATAQALGVLAQARGLGGPVRVWSYGSPRPGVELFAGFVERIDNSRFMTLTDVVPHLPPNSQDNLSLAAILTTGQLRLANRLVQTPWGYTVDAVTGITPASNNNASLNFAGFTIFGSAFVTTFGASNSAHLLQTYNAAFAASEPHYIAPTRPPPPNPELPIVQTVRQREVVVAQAEAIIRADATAPSGLTRSYVVPPALLPSSPRYVAKKMGLIWTIQLSNEIVGVGTGKRDAKSIARKWNRAARAALRQ